MSYKNYVVFDFIAIWVIHLFKKYLKILLRKYQRLPNDWIIQLWTIFLYELKLYSHYCLFTILLLSPLLSKATNSLKAWLCIDFTTVCLLSCLTTPLNHGIIRSYTQLLESYYLTLTLLYFHKDFKRTHKHIACLNQICF